MELLMSVEEMINQLGVDSEDEGHSRHPVLIKQRALNIAQLTLCQRLRNEYLGELKVLEDNQSLTNDVLALSDLTYTVLRSDAGILKIKCNGGLWAIKQELEDQKRTENPDMAGSDRNPLYMVHENEIKMYTDTVTAIDVYYMRNPNPLLYVFALTEHGTPSKVDFLGPASKGLVEENDYYNGSVVYLTQESMYAVVKLYVGATRDFEIYRDDAAANLTTGSFYFVTSPFKITGLDNHYCELNVSLHPLVLKIAEAQLWGRDGKLDRKNEALDFVDKEVAVLNARYEPSVGVGRRQEKASQ